MRYVVTGGSGFVGRALLAELIADGHTVGAVVRSDASARLVRDLGAEPVPAELTDVEALRAAMRGADVVVHLAAETDLAQPWATFVRTNVDGTKAVLAAAAGAGVGTLVHISSEAVLADGRPLHRAGDDRPPTDRPAGRYSATKAEAERLVRAASGIPRVVVLRPRFVWGIGDTTLLPSLVAAARSGALVWIGGGTYLTSTTHVRNLTAAIRLVAEDSRAQGVYMVTDGVDRPFRAVVTGLLASQDVPAPRRSVPHVVAAATASAYELAWRVLRRPGKPPLTRQELALIGQEMTVDDSRIRTELGFRNAVSVEAGLAELTAAGAGTGPAR